MIYRFGDFELDEGKVELRLGTDIVAIEPQVFDLILLLVQNAGRLVSKDEIIESVWNGRFVSESAVASRIKSARQALNDSGKTQSVIKTVHGRGFRFVAEIEVEAGSVSISPVQVTETPQPSVASPGDTPQKPSIAILPFHLNTPNAEYAGIADAIPHDLITELARLRWLFVIARGSSFKFRSLDADVTEIGQTLGVRYCLTGGVEFIGSRVTLRVEIADTKTGGIIWADDYATPIDAIHEVRAKIVASIVSSLELQIPNYEAQLARLATSENLGAWSTYHLGLLHLFRFNKADNEKAGILFDRAINLDPGFARAYAGLSSTHFQNAFLKYTPNPDEDAAKAVKFAERSLELDALDPFANFNMGRTFWLSGDLDSSMTWLERTTSLSPNYAQAVYSQAWTETMSGRGQDGIEHADMAMALSPLDPFYYAMMGTRAKSHIIQGDDAAAAEWADKAARSPGAHVLIAMIAVIAHELNNDREKAAKWAQKVRSRSSGLTQADYFAAFPHRDEVARARMSDALKRHGF